jgi:hypothetical protein
MKVLPLDKLKVVLLLTKPSHLMPLINSKRFKESNKSVSAKFKKAQETQYST